MVLVVFQGAIADGYLTISNAYDGYMYVFGKGESTTTVSAPKTSVPKGTALMIEGTVFGSVSWSARHTMCICGFDDIANGVLIHAAAKSWSKR